MHATRRAALARLGGIAAALSAPLARAQDQVESSLRLVVPLPPGSGGDNIARILASRLRVQLGQPVLVENRAGGDMMIGTAHVAKAPADGRTLLMGHISSMVLNPLAYSQVHYHPQQDFLPIGKISESTAVMVVNPAVPARTLDEFVALVRRQPDKLSYGTAILMVQVSGEQLVHTRGLQIARVPYKGGAQLMQDTVAHHIDMSIADTSSYLALIRAGKLRPLATTGARRNPLLPDVPTVREAGYPEMEVVGWWGLFAPAGTPQEVANRVGAALRATLGMPDVIEQLRAIGAEPNWMAGQELAREMTAQSQHWGAVIKTLKINASE